MDAETKAGETCLSRMDFPAGLPVALVEDEESRPPNDLSEERRPPPAPAEPPGDPLPGAPLRGLIMSREVTGSVGAAVEGAPPVPGDCPLELKMPLGRPSRRPARLGLEPLSAVFCVAGVPENPVSASVGSFSRSGA